MIRVGVHQMSEPAPQAVERTLAPELPPANQDAIVVARSRFIKHSSAW